MTTRWQDAPQADFAVLGKPIAHSLSPMMHGAAFQVLGLEYRYVALEVEPEELAPALDFLRDKGYEGVNLTVPLKEAVMPLLDNVEDFALACGAANCIRLDDYTGINTDGPGFIETLHDLEIDERKDVLLIGSGGSAASIGLALVDIGFNLRIWSRDPNNAARLAARLGDQASVSVELDPKGVGMLVNATPASLFGESLPVLWGRCDPDAVAYDLAYGMQLKFLDDAAAHTRMCVDGLMMLMEQGALAFEWWLGLPAPRDAMLSCLLEAKL
ncbi:MAG: shikimate dehydrogenase [Armatimonadetes bacterium]|nr:shikimate dehydrogenase [Armatimonadota bacterium]